MSEDRVFSWAENAEGRLVHVDSVPNGLRCGCTCPCCHEPLLARHGHVKEHGFAHHSDNRGANLDICYQVVMYKLAEQILRTEKRILVPSYYGIFQGGDLAFAEVKTDSRYEREDKQPDVVAVTTDGRQFLIELVFEYKVQHKQAIDYKNLTCLEIDLSGQSLESVREFLLFKTDGKRWLNHHDFFNQIEARYQQAGKSVRLVAEQECRSCSLPPARCCAVRCKQSYDILIIENNGLSYRLCKTEKYDRAKREWEQQQILERERREKEEREAQARAAEAQKRMEADRERKQLLEQERIVQMREKFDCARTCYECALNLAWGSTDDYAHCGSYGSMGVPKKTPPDSAMACRGFQKKTP